MPRGVAPRLSANVGEHLVGERTGICRFPAGVAQGRDGRPRRSGRPGQAAVRPAGGRRDSIWRGAGRAASTSGRSRRSTSPPTFGRTPGAGPDRQAAPRRHSGALRLARRPPGLAREPGRARIRADGVAGHRQRRSTSVAAEHRLDAPHGEGGSPCRPLSAPRRVLRVSGGSQSGRLKLPAATITALRAEPLDRRSDSDVREHRSYWRALCDLPGIAAPTRARTDAWSYGHSSFARGPTR